MNRLKHPWLSFLPVPSLIALIAIIYSRVDPSVFYDPAWLILIGNTLFVTVVFFVVSLIAMRNYRATGRFQILFLGCGVLVFGIGGVIAAAVRSLPDGANLNVTIYNTAALLAALFHFVAAFLLVSGISAEAGPKRRSLWLILSYGGSIVLVALLALASLEGWTPAFKVQGALGFTPLRQMVLGGADILFCFAFVIFMGMYLRKGEVFLYWYSCALAFTAISLTAFFIQSSVGSPVGWAGRFSQYLGGVYFLISLIRASRSAQSRQTSLDNVLTASLAGGEEKFRALADNVPDVIRRFDRETRHLYVNPACLRLYGRPAAAVIGKTVDQVGLSARRAGTWKEMVEKVFRTGERIEVEENVPAAAGGRFYQSLCVPELGPDGAVANVLAVSRDLTERKLAEEKYRSLFNGMTEGFAIHEIITDADGRPVDYRFLDINPAFERLTGLKREQVVGRTHNEVLPENDPTWVRAYGEVALTGKPVQFENYAASLGRHYEVFAYRPAPRQFAVIFMDITERKAALEVMQEAMDELSRSNRDLEQFAYVASHDLQEPLRQVRSFSQLLRDRYADRLDGKASEFLQFVIEGADRMSGLVYDLLAYSRVGSRDARYVTVSCQEALDKALANLEAGIAESRARITHDDLPTVTAEPTQMVQLFQNLVGNAIKFRRDGLAPEIHVGSRRDGASWRLSVTDNGIGIDPRYHPKIFLLFQRLHTRGTYPGTGIGLAICKKVVEQLGGRIWVESEVGKGSTFFFTLPRTLSEDAPPA